MVLGELLQTRAVEGRDHLFDLVWVKKSYYLCNPAIANNQIFHIFLD